MRGIVYAAPFTKTVKNGGRPIYTVSFALAFDPLLITGRYLVVADGTPLSSFDVTPGARLVQIQTNRYGRWTIYRGLEPWTTKQTLSAIVDPRQYPVSDILMYDTALCVFEDFDVTDFNGRVPTIEIIASTAATPARCPCADMDWMGHDMTAAHHPDCPTRRPVARDDREVFIPGKVTFKFDITPELKRLQADIKKALDDLSKISLASPPPPCPKAEAWDARCKPRALEFNLDNLLFSDEQRIRLDLNSLLSRSVFPFPSTEKK